MEEKDCEQKPLSAKQLRKKKNDHLVNLLFNIFEEEDKLIDKNNHSMYFRLNLTRLIRELKQELDTKRKNAIEITKK